MASQIGVALAVAAAATLVALALRPYLAATNLAMIYLLGVVAIALRCSRAVSIAASFLNVAAFDFFCVPPYLTMRVSHPDYVFTFLGMLVVALVISAQTARIRTHAESALQREARAQTLYELSRRLSRENRVVEVARAAAEFAEEVLPAQVAVFLPSGGEISFQRRSSERLPVPRSEQPLAQWAYDKVARAGLGAQNSGGSSAMYLPLRGARDVVGVLCAVPSGGKALQGETLRLLEVVASQAATAIERTQSQHAAEDARVQMRNEEIRSSLLSAVSHDLRTPLASITGAASALRSQGDKLAPETRQELLDSIADEADRLGRLVTNLLDMTRLESGVELIRDAYPLEEIIGSALQRMERHLVGREVTANIPEALPLVYVDEVLVGQLVINLLENASKYTPEGAAIDITAEADGDFVTLDVMDRGPGFPHADQQRIFEKFYRAESEGVRGMGLGLAICRAIAEAHRGSIEALNRTGGGAVFRVRLPAATQ
jgi:two-component system, OmpR family, sensor histidine kinase KdpD